MAQVVDRQRNVSVEHNGSIGVDYLYLRDGVYEAKDFVYDEF